MGCPKADPKQGLGCRGFTREVIMAAQGVVSKHLSLSSRPTFLHTGAGLEPASSFLLCQCLPGRESEGLEEGEGSCSILPVFVAPAAPLHLGRGSTSCSRSWIQFSVSPTFRELPSWSSPLPAISQLAHLHRGLGLPEACHVHSLSTHGREGRVSQVVPPPQDPSTVPASP